jgi:hypothetical protein
MKKHQRNKFNKTRKGIEKLLREMRFSTVVEWRRYSCASNMWARSQSWYNEVATKYNIRTRENKISYKRQLTRFDVEELLKKNKFSCIREWEKKDIASLRWARGQSWYHKVAKRYNLKTTGNKVSYKRQFTRQEIEEILKKNKFSCIGEWEKKDITSLRWARSQSWYHKVANRYNLKTTGNKVSYKRQFTRQEIEEILKKNKFQKTSEWQIQEQESYYFSVSQSWHTDVASKFGLKTRNLNRTKDDIINLLTNESFASITEWKRKDSNSYLWASKKDWFEEVLDEFNLKKEKRSREQIERILNKNMFSCIGEWEREDESSVRWARKQGWYEEVVSLHNLRIKKFSVNKEEVLKFIEENKITSSKQWSELSYKSYKYSLRQTWAQEVKDKIEENKKNLFIRNLIDELNISQYETINDLKKCVSKIYIKDSINCIEEKITKLFNDSRKLISRSPKEMESKIKLSVIVNKFSSTKEWRSNCPSSYKYSIDNGFLQEIKKTIKENKRQLQINEIRNHLEKYKYITVSEWASTSPKTYNRARSLKVTDILITEYHIESKYIVKNRKHLEFLLSKKEIQSISHWFKELPQYYRWASFQPWYKEILEDFNLTI